MMWSVLAGGALTGKYRLEADGQPFEKGNERSHMAAFMSYIPRFTNPKVQVVIDRHGSVVRNAVMSLRHPSRAASSNFAYCTSRGGAHSRLPR